MKKYVSSLFMMVVLFSVHAQVPQGISYQAVVRDAQGNILPNQQVAFQFSILQGSANGNAVYTEQHSVQTNSLGLVNMAIGNGTPTLGNFSAINWQQGPYFLNVAVDVNGGSNFIDMGTTQLLSVPYALYAENAGNVQTYVAGNGIQINGNVIENTAPDQPITLTGTGATTVTGTYPNFTISSTDNNTTYSAGTGLNLTGTTFSHEPHTGDVSGTTSLTVTGIQGKAVSSAAPANNQVLQWNGTNWAPTNPSNLIQAGNGLNYSGNTLNTVWTQAGNNIYNNNTGRVGIGLTAPTGKVTIQGDTSNVLFEVRDKDGNPVFVVYQDSVHIFVSNSSTGTKSNKGTFAVSAKAQTKTGAKPIFQIVPDSIVEIIDRQGLPVFRAFQDSVHVYVDNTGSKSNKGTFAVSAKAQTKAGGTNYLRITPDSSRIYTQDTIAGFGVRNIGNGQVSSYMQLTPKNYFIGHESGKGINFGRYNLAFGFQAGKNLNNGGSNVFIGYQSGLNNTTGSGNTFIGNVSGKNNIDGNWNVYIGDSAGYNNVNGFFNVFIGYQAGKNYTLNNSTFIGTASGFLCSTGTDNTFIGNSTGFYTINGNENTFVGTLAGVTNSSGHKNTIIGTASGRNLDIHTGRPYHENVFVGAYIANSINSNANFNTIIGTYAGNKLSYGSRNVFIGYKAGYNETGSNKLYISNSDVDNTNALIYGEFDNKILRYNAKVGVNIYPQYQLHVEANQSTGINTGLAHFVNTATNNDAAGVYASCKSTDFYGYGGYFEGGYTGVYARISPTGNGSYYGVNGSVYSTTGGGFRYGVFGRAYGNNGTKYGLYGLAEGAGTTNYGIYATATGATTNYAGYFQGNVHVNGTLSKSAGTFKIDHPLDPENKYLVHSFVESPDMKNVYDGVVTLDQNGRAIVTLPAYFEALNKDFRYQLTPIGSPSPNLHIEQEIQNNQFIIAGGSSGLKVSWQVTGIRKDPYAIAYPIIPEQEKLPQEKGKYLNPELYHQPQTKAIYYTEPDKKNLEIQQSNNKIN